MNRLIRFLMTLGLVLLPLLAIVSLPALAATVPSAGLLRHYAFDGNSAPDQIRRQERDGVLELSNVAFARDALFLDGEAYRAVAVLPDSLASSAGMTIALEFHNVAGEARNAPDALFAAGDRGRWLAASLVSSTRGGGGQSGRRMLEIGINGMALRFIYPQTQVEPGQWHHLAVAADFKGRKIRAVLDGKRLPDVTVVAGFRLGRSPSPLAVHLQNPVTDAGLQGFVDNLLVYGRVLSAAEMGQIYASSRRAQGLLDAPARPGRQQAVVPEETPVEVATPAPVRPPVNSPVAAPAETRTADAIVAGVLRLTNQERAAQGVAPLTLDPALTRAAQAHAENMARQRNMNHDLDGLGVSDRVSAQRYVWGYVAENIAMGQESPEEVLQSWMDSPGHRRNILSASAQHIGIGYARAGGRIYWCQVFGKPLR